jgi:hypothetical protein
MARAPFHFLSQVVNKYLSASEMLAINQPTMCVLHVNKEFNVFETIKLTECVKVDNIDSGGCYRVILGRK